MINNDIGSISVFERDGKTDREYNVYSRLLKDRIIFLTGDVTTSKMNLIVAQLLFLESDDSSKSISLYINSPGGSVTAGLALYDTMQFIKAPVHTVCIGQAASMGAILLAAGSPGKRTALPNSEIMIHQPSWHSAGGSETEIKIHADLMTKCRKRLEAIMSKHTGIGLKQMHKLMERDLYISAEEALKLNIIDKIAKVNK